MCTSLCRGEKKIIKNILNLELRHSPHRQKITMKNFGFILTIFALVFKVNDFINKTTKWDKYITILIGYERSSQSPFSSIKQYYVSCWCFSFSLSQVSSGCGDMGQNESLEVLPSPHPIDLFIEPKAMVISMILKIA